MNIRDFASRTKKALYVVDNLSTVTSRRTTASLIALQTLFYLVSGKKAFNH